MELPERLGKYLLVERIAVGGMAEIFKARTAGLGGFEKVLAVKRLHPRYCEDADFIKMLIDEAKIAVQLSHSNIGQIFDLDHLGEYYFISMEFIDGRDLHRVQRRLNDAGRKMPIDLACFVSKEVCAGLDYAHRKVTPDGTPLRIIHRDVSPQNILISWEGEVKIVDFGIAKAARRAYETESGIIKGKFYYMSPEQARGEEIDHRSDIFSLGVVLYEMLTGHLLYADTDDKDSLLNKVRQAQIAPPSRLRRDVPKRLDRIVMKALARERDDRYQSAAAFGDALARFIHQTSPNGGPTALARFVRGLFEEAKFQSEPVPDHEHVLMSRYDFQVDSTSLIYADPESEALAGRADQFDQDPFFADDTHVLEDGKPMSPQHPSRGDEIPRTSDVNVIDERDIEIIEDDPSQEPPEDLLDDDPTVVKKTPEGIIDDLGTLDGLFDARDPLDDEPTQIYRPQAVLAASPGAEHGPLRGEARLEVERKPSYSEDEEPTVITSITHLAEGHHALHPLAPPRPAEPPIPAVEVRDSTHPRAYRGGLLGFDSVRSSPALMIAIFLIVLALGAALAFGVQLFFAQDEESGGQTATATEIPPPAPQPAATLSSYYVTSNPTGARVTLDGAFMGPTPTTVEGLQVGQSYRLRVEAEGFNPHEEMLSPENPGAHSVAYTLEPRLGTAVIQTNPTGAAVSLNGNFVQMSPATIPGLDTRLEHVVTASLPGYQVAHQRLVWPPGSTEPLDVHLVLTPLPTPPAVTQTTATSEPDETRTVASRDREEEHESQSSSSRDDERRSTDRTSSSRDTSSRDTSSRDTASQTAEEEPERYDRTIRRDRTHRDRTSRTTDEEREPDRTRSEPPEEEPPAETASASQDETGRLTVQADSEAHVFIDGRVVATEVPLVEHELEPGTHRVKVYFVGLRRFSGERRVRVVAGETRSVHFADTD